LILAEAAIAAVVAALVLLVVAAEVECPEKEQGSEGT